MLEELGEPYRLHLVDLKKNEQKSPAHLAINPMGKVPALDHDGVIITEGAAICCYLADAFPKAGLAAPIGDRRRGPYLKWLFFGPGCLEPAIVDRMLKREPGPQNALGYGSFETTLDVVAGAVARGPFLDGDRFTAADIVLGSTVRFGMGMTKIVPERPEFLRYVRALDQRPAWQRVEAKTEELAAAQAG